MKKNNFLIICLLLILVFSINASAFDIDEFKENFNQIKTEFEDREANFSIARNIKEAILYEILYIDDFFVNLESGLEDKSVENQLKTMSAMFLDEVESYRNLPEGKPSPPSKSNPLLQIHLFQLTRKRKKQALKKELLTTSTQ